MMKVLLIPSFNRMVINRKERRLPPPKLTKYDFIANLGSI